MRRVGLDGALPYVEPHASAIDVELGGVTIRVRAPEHPRTMKRVAGASGLLEGPLSVESDDIVAQALRGHEHAVSIEFARRVLEQQLRSPIGYATQLLSYTFDKGPYLGSCRRAARARMNRYKQVADSLNVPRQSGSLSQRVNTNPLVLRVFERSTQQLLPQHVSPQSGHMYE
jgi:hypothetical protein